MHAIDDHDLDDFWNGLDDLVEALREHGGFATYVSKAALAKNDVTGFGANALARLLRMDVSVARANPTAGHLVQPLADYAAALDAIARDRARTAAPVGPVAALPRSPTAKAAPVILAPRGAR